MASRVASAHAAWSASAALLRPGLARSLTPAPWRAPANAQRRTDHSLRVTGRQTERRRILMSIETSYLWHPGAYVTQDSERGASNSFVAYGTKFAEAAPLPYQPDRHAYAQHQFVVEDDLT